MLIKKKKANPNTIDILLLEKTVWKASVKFEKSSRY